MIRRYFDLFPQLQPASFHPTDPFLPWHPQLCLRAAWLSKNRRLVARALMPIDDSKQTVCFECAGHRLRKARSVRNTVKGVRQKNKIDRASEPRNIVGVTGNKLTIRQPAFYEPVSRNFQQARININCGNMLCSFGNLKGEPP